MTPPRSLDYCAQVNLAGRPYRIADIVAFGGPALRRLPVVLRILLENSLRHSAGDLTSSQSILEWATTATSHAEIPFHPGRLLMHDTTCVPALVDIAAMRSAVAEAGRDPSLLNPVLPIDVSVDHSIAVDYYGTPDALRLNMAREIERNSERYRLLKWATHSLRNVRVHPPGTGIMHTMNLERLANVVSLEDANGGWAFPDTLIGTDSHTPMINGIGVLGWGVGGLEAESVMFGMPVMLKIPEVLGVRMTGRLPEGTLATDLALAVTQRLRALPLSGKFVEFFGPGVATLSCGERAVVANMAPEYGASCGFFAVDPQTLKYLRATGRPDSLIHAVETYCRRQELWFDADVEPRYSEVVEIDLGAVETSLAGPRRPQDRLAPRDTRAALRKASFAGAARTGGHETGGTNTGLGGRTHSTGGATRGLAANIAAAATASPAANPVAVAGVGANAGPPIGAVAIAAITSCTNTSDPRLMVAAGLLARKARALGLACQPWVKTSLAPGSPAAELYLRRSNLLADLESLGFGIVGYGCTTCIGNSGPLSPGMMEAVQDRGLAPVAVLSGNRNFPGRVHPLIEASFLASPPLVVAYALAGDVDRDITSDPIGQSVDGRTIYLRDIWPTGTEIDAALAASVTPADFFKAYQAAEDNEIWRNLDAPSSPLFPWGDESTYIRRPPFASADTATRLGSYVAHPLLVLGDDITTDHISPAGQVPAGSDAAEYLVARGENAKDLNVFAARRGNWEAMLRGLFTNSSVRNLLAPGIPPGSTIHAGSGTVLPLRLAAGCYQADQESVVVIAGERYGTGSSRDWAAKGLWLLGVRAVLALSFERIHRSNLIGMGILPIVIPEPLALTVGDTLAIDAEPAHITPRARVSILIQRGSGKIEALIASIAVETALEVALLKEGGILPHILRRISKEAEHS